MPMQSMSQRILCLAVVFVTQSNTCPHSEQNLIHIILQVFWEGDGAWYRGSVTGYSATTQRHTILYDDNDIERVVLDAVPHRCIYITVNEMQLSVS